MQAALFSAADKLFLLNKQGGAVCATRASVVSTTSGSTLNLIAHYNSPSVEDEDAYKKLEEAMVAKKAAEKGGAGEGTLDSFTQ